LTGTYSAIDRSYGDRHIETAMKRMFANSSYYYPDEVGTG